jgi:lipopolysaccharide/colanic/teichoic acid biosynthesis glycosyltransferase
MYVHRRRLYTVAQAAVDVLSLWFIWLCTTELRILLNPLTARQVFWDAALWVPSRTVVLLLWIAASLRLRLYRVPDEIRPTTIVSWAAENSFAICTLTVLATFFSRQFGAGTSRLFVLCLAPVSFLVLAMMRGLALAILAAVQHRWPPPRIALICDLNHAKTLLSSLESRLASAIWGVIVPETARVAAAGHKTPVLGTTRQLAELVNRERINQVIILSRSLSDSEVEHCKRILWRMGLPVSYALVLPNELNRERKKPRRHSRLELSRQYGLPTVEVAPIVLTEPRELAKRAFDVGLACVLLVLLGPALSLIALLVKLTSKGPLFKKTLHVGQGGRHFHGVTFRTREAQQPHRTTRIGRVLLRCRADELPQLANILRGRMSFVGPAPLPVKVLQNATAGEEAATWTETRSLVQPGLTGLWQTGARTFSFDEMMPLDLEYIQNRSLLLDLGILLRTPAAVLRGVRLAEYPSSRAYFIAAVS